MSNSQRHIGRDLHRLDNCIGRFLFKHCCECKTNDEVTSTNMRIIRFLKANENYDVYQKDVEKEFGITRSTASRVLVLMEQKGLITRSGVEHDARLKKLTLTPKSLAINDIMNQNGMEIEEQLLFGFTEEEKDTLFAFLQRMSENVK